MVLLRKIREQDLEQYKYWKLPIHDYHKLNGPYFNKKTKEEIESEIQLLRNELENGIVDPLPRKRIISNEKNEVIGEVSWYWKSEETLWLEIGIVIFNNNFWGKGIGYVALELWIKDIFKIKKELVRIGLTTWSGNIGMIKLAEKIGMKKEAEYRKARIINGIYYDSISYGILREEWEAR